MNSSHLEHLYNCSASILELNITLLLRLNFNEIRYFIEGALNKSTMRDHLRQALLDCILVNQKRPFDLPWWQKLFWSLIFAVILLVATGGNIIVMWIQRCVICCRYMAIMHPLKHHMSRKRTVITLILIWGISSALAIPCLLYSTTSLR
ncbi:hypothetical protein P5V15_007371, partial [Pogonomyrmex californicus]